MSIDRFKQQRLAVTDEGMFWNRRQFIKQMGVGGMTIAGFGLGGGEVRGADQLTAIERRIIKPGITDKELLGKFPYARNAAFGGKGVALTDRLTAARYNNYYEFLPGRGGPVWRHVSGFKPEPWKVKVHGLCSKPKTFDLDDIFKIGMEERVYHFRCVETWAMNVPWTGFALHKLLKQVEPLSGAKYVRFKCAKRPKEMPGMAQSIAGDWGYNWPYYEGLRMDEAMNELAMIVTGVYGQALPIQHGSPLRVIVPWKYGYKSPKAIVEIELLDKKPETFWTEASDGAYKHEYGFYSNVNPNIPHPRWSQATSHLLEAGVSSRGGTRIKTEIYNGYGKYVAKLYPNEPVKPIAGLKLGQTAR